MPLVDYSGSEDEFLSEASNVPIVTAKPGKRKRDEENELARGPTLPPLPQNFHSLYATSTRTHPSDDPALHGGRTRQVPHIQGNWPTHVYLEWYPARTELEILQSVVEAANTNGQLHSLLRSELGAQLPLHISLSAPLVLKAEHKSVFEDTLQWYINGHKIARFEAKLHRLRWECNFDATRWFLVLGIGGQQDGCGDELVKLLECCNACASIFDLPLLYEKYTETTRNNGQGESRSNRTVAQKRADALHISIAWQLAEPSFKQRIVLAHPRVPELANETLPFEVVKLKMGNVVDNIELPKAVGM